MQGDLPFGDRNVFNYPESKVQLGKRYKRTCAFLLLQLFFLRNTSRYLKARMLTQYWSQHFTVSGHLGGQVWTVCLSRKSHACTEATKYPLTYIVEVVSQVLETRKSRGRQTPDRYSQPLYHDSWSSHLYNMINLLAKRTGLMIPACSMSEKTAVCAGHTCIGGRNCFHELYP